MRKNAALLWMVTALALSATPASTQTQPDPPSAAQTKPAGTTSGLSQEEPADRSFDTPGRERHTVGDTDGRPANPAVKDETVGFGGSIDRAPRDIREPFDE